MLTIMKTSITVCVFSFSEDMFVESIERWWMFSFVEISRVLNESALKKKMISSISIKINFFDWWVKTSSTSNWSIDWSKLRIESKMKLSFFSMKDEKLKTDELSNVNLLRVIFVRFWIRVKNRFESYFSRKRKVFDALISFENCLIEVVDVFRSDDECSLKDELRWTMTLSKKLRYLCDCLYSSIFSKNWLIVFWNSSTIFTVQANENLIDSNKLRVVRAAIEFDADLADRKWITIITIIVWWNSDTKSVICWWSILMNSEKCYVSIINSLIKSIS